jgi:hypothetical protein
MPERCEPEAVIPREVDEKQSFSSGKLSVGACGVHDPALL